MYAGKVVEQASVFDLFETPQHPYTKGLLKSVLSIDEYKDKLEGIPGSVPDLVTPPSGCRFFERCDCAVEKCSIEPPPPFLLENDREVFCWLFEGNLHE